MQVHAKEKTERRCNRVPHGCMATTAAAMLLTTALAPAQAPAQSESAPGRLISASALAGPNVNNESDWTIARIWNERVLEAVRNDSARPPVHSRNLYHTSAAMWDAWAVYDEHAIGVFNTEKQMADDVQAAREVAISYAVYRVLKHRFANSPGAATTMANIDAQMDDLGLDKDFTSAIGNTPAAVGNRTAAIILMEGYGDGSNEAFNYAWPFYEPMNEPLVVEAAGAPTLVYPSNWQSIWLNVFIDQQGNVLDGNVPSFVGPHWGYVTPFALSSEHETPGKPGVYLDPGPPPQLGESPEETALWLDTFTDVLLTSSNMDPDVDEFIDISPSVFGNNTLGMNDSPGHGPNNPVTGEPYEPNVVRLADYARIIAEFWADGPTSSTPPGHWNEMANEFVADHPDFHFQLGGEGEPLDRLEWDVKMYLAVNGAAHDAAVACWGVKGYYDFVRPISAIRHMADNGQRTDPNLPSYHPHGLPLIPGKVELITEETIAPGGHHACLAEMVVDEFGNPVIGPDGGFLWDAEQFIGEVAVLTWPGSPQGTALNPGPVSLPWLWIHPDCTDPAAPYSGVQWIRAKRWSTYQLPTFITPPFAGYTSGHTTFSRAIAEVLTELTGTHYFPGGLAEYHFPEGEALEFEYGPSEDFALQWTSFYDGSDQAARSRIYGGIHPYVDDFPARFQGHDIGLIVAAKAFEHYNVQGEAPACPWDLNGDGVVNVQDLLELVHSFGVCPPEGSCPGDFNDDGKVNAKDLLLLIGNQGDCPDE